MGPLIKTKLSSNIQRLLRSAIAEQAQVYCGFCPPLLFLVDELQTHCWSSGSFLGNISINAVSGWEGEGKKGEGEGWEREREREMGRETLNNCRAANALCISIHGSRNKLWEDKRLAWDFCDMHLDKIPRITGPFPVPSHAGMSYTLKLTPYFIFSTASANKTQTPLHLFNTEFIFVVCNSKA